MPGRLRIIGGVPLVGTATVSGSKNATLPIMAAAILADGPVTLDGVPQLADVATLREVLAELGIVTHSRGAQLRLLGVDTRPTTAPYRLVRRMRASFCVLGPLLARRGAARVALPGGCNLGHRPVDLHLAGLAALGAEIRVERGYVVARARRLRGARITLTGPNGPTVTGTANVLCAATLSRGTTVLRGAAREPEVVDLGNFLIALGAEISGLGTSTLKIRGVEQLGGATHRVIPDRIEAATLLLCGAVTGGRVTVEGAEAAHLGAVLDALGSTGAELNVRGDKIEIAAPQRPRPRAITARPYPGIPSDVQSQWLSLSAVAGGSSVIRDRVFPARWQHAAELCRMGADIRLGPRGAAVRGVRRLSGATVTACDLRASAALVLAALAAYGATTLRGVEHLDRGYERLEEKLAALGARIERLQPRRAGWVEDPPFCRA